jgi:small subunit ribosomal protein S7
MARRKAAQKRTICPDSVFGSMVVAGFINNLMRDGKKSVAEKVFYGALEIVAKKSMLVKSESSTGIRDDAGLKAIALEAFLKCLDILRPMVEVKARRVGGANYQVPMEVTLNRGMALAIRWLLTAARLRSEKTMELRLSSEMIDVQNGRGGAIKKRDTVYSMAKANQAFAHFRW